jgi:hypothetical protein
MMEELKPCPFCGCGRDPRPQVSDVPQRDHADMFCGQCMNCAARTDDFCTEAEAVAAWNRRSPSDTGAREALETARKAVSVIFSCASLDEARHVAKRTIYGIEVALSPPVDPIAEDLAKTIETLRAEEGDSITILCDDPEATTGKDRMAVECIGNWTNWRTKRYYGDSVNECLRNAAMDRDALRVYRSRKDGEANEKNGER